MATLKVKTASGYNTLQTETPFSIPVQVPEVVTSISSSSTDSQVPSAKCVYDKLETKNDKITKTTNIECGNLELYSESPHVDFHLNNTSQDYSSRIIQKTNGLFCNGHGDIHGEYPLDHIFDTAGGHTYDSNGNLNDAPNGFSAFYNPTNKPSSFTEGWIYCLTIQFRDAGYKIQFCIGLSQLMTKIFVRQLTNSSWTSWVAFTGA